MLFWYLWISQRAMVPGQKRWALVDLRVVCLVVQAIGHHRCTPFSLMLLCVHCCCAPSLSLSCRALSSSFDVIACHCCRCRVPMHCCHRCTVMPLSRSGSLPGGPLPVHHCCLLHLCLHLRLCLVTVPSPCWVLLLWCHWAPLSCAVCMLCTVGIHSLARCLGCGPVNGVVERALLGFLACGVCGCCPCGVPLLLLSRLSMSLDHPE